MEALELVRHLRLAALVLPKEELEERVIQAKELLEQIPRGPEWNTAVGYVNGMVEFYYQRFGRYAPPSA